LRKYLSLVKPGIIFGNLISSAGGFFLGARGHINFPHLLITLVGLALVIGGGCALNNCIDQDIDSVMKRTQRRVLVVKAMSVKLALSFGVGLVSIGLIVLYLGANYLAASIAAFGFFVYVFAYSLWFKRTAQGTWVGALSGAVPPLVAYCAASNQFDWPALILYVMYILWQFPHAHAIAILHLDDYRLISMPILPVVRGADYVRKRAPYEITIYLVCASLLFFFGDLGLIYLSTLISIGVLWIRVAALSPTKLSDRLWAQQSVAYSILMVSAISLTMALNWV
jgi:protoheme IX farnesyltransferase